MKISNLGPIEKLVGEESRYSVQYVWFDAEKGRLVATNGHALIILACQADPGDVTGPITTEALDTWRQFTKSNSLPHMVKFQALATELVVEDLAEGKRFSYRRPTGVQYPEYEKLIPDLKGRPPDVTFDPSLLEKVVSAFPKDELRGGKGSIPSISLWIDKAHVSRTAKQIEDDKKAKKVVTVPPIVIKASHEGALCVMMPVTGLSELHWHTEIPGLPLPKPAEGVSAPEPPKTTTEPVASAPVASGEPPAPSEAQSKPETKAEGKKPKSAKPPKSASPVPVHPNGHDTNETHVA